MSYRQNYLDLDPTYRDRYGRPLMRMTFDFQQNDRSQANFIADVLREDRASDGRRGRRTARSPAALYSIVPYRAHTITGGAVMEPIRRKARLILFTELGRVERVRHRRLRLPAESGKEPHCPVGAVALRTADSIKSYLKESGAAGARLRASCC